MEGRFIGKDSEGSGCGLIELLSQYMPGGTEETYECLNMLDIVTVEILTESSQNKSVYQPDQKQTSQRYQTWLNNSVHWMVPLNAFGKVGTLIPTEE
jgi:hypothetical protein